MAVGSRTRAVVGCEVKRSAVIRRCLQFGSCFPVDQERTLGGSIQRHQFDVIEFTAIGTGIFEFNGYGFGDGSIEIEVHRFQQAGSGPIGRYGNVVLGEREEMGSVFGDRNLHGGGSGSGSERQGEVGFAVQVDIAERHGRCGSRPPAECTRCSFVTTEGVRAPDRLFGGREIESEIRCRTARHAEIERRRVVHPVVDYVRMCGAESDCEDRGVGDGRYELCRGHIDAESRQVAQREVQSAACGTGYAAGVGSA